MTYRFNALRRILPILLALVLVPSASAQTEADDEAAFGGWYMYFGTANVGDGPFAVHGEVQLRNHEVVGDLQQLLLRTSGRYTLPDGSATLALGYGFIHSEAEGEPDNGFDEHRIYQEALLKQRVSVVRVSHRFRHEQRFVEDTDFQTRYRYALFANVPLNRADMGAGTLYAAGYNEIFLRGIGRDDRPVFDRNRVYGALGYGLRDGLNVQLGYMEQIFASDTDGQIQVSLHHSFGL